MLLGYSPFTKVVVEMAIEDDSVLPYLVPIFKSPSVPLPQVITTDPSQVYSRHPRSSDPPPASSPESNISHPPLVSNVAPPRYPTRIQSPPSHFLLS